MTQFHNMQEETVLIILTQNTTPIIGQVAKLLGWIMNAIFNLLDLISIPKIGIAILLFTIVIYLLMTPLTIKQQKFSKMSAKMNPEIQAIQAKYKGKKDNESMQAMNQQTQAIYAKYGVSPTGSCLQLAIQMPILFALYRVIYAMPAYVPKIRDAFVPFVTKFINTEGSAAYLKNADNFSVVGQFSKQLSTDTFQTVLNSGATNLTAVQNTEITNTFIDILNRASVKEIASLKEHFTALSGTIDTMIANLDKYNVFLGLNMSHSPKDMINEFLANQRYFMIVVALMIPLLAAVTQWISIKLSPQQSQTTGEQSQMASSMKMMNVLMPIMSLFFCFTLPAGLGLYWIAGAVVRTIQQIIINKHIDKIDLDALIEKNKEKQKKKIKRLEKAGMNTSTLTSAARINTKNVDTSQSVTTPSVSSKQGSLSQRANMVKEFNEKNNR